MKTKKHLGKKVLSVFLAVLMVMTAWVFVPGGYNQVSAVSSTSIATDNTNTVNGIANLNTNHDATFTYGRFPYDDSYVTDDYYYQVYKNVLHSTTVVTNDYGAAYQWSLNMKDNDAGGFAYYYPESTLLYDGSGTMPSIGVILRSDSNSNKRIRTYSGYIYSGANGLQFGNTYWRGKDGRLNFMWNYFNNASTTVATTDGSVNGSICYTHANAGEDYYYTNILQFSGAMNSNEYLREIYPTFGWRGNQASQGTGEYYTFSATASYPVRVINFVPLKNALQEAVNVKNQILANPDKYTLESVNEFAALAKALVAAKPGNFVSSASNNYTGYRDAASAAVNAWNAWHTDNTIGGLNYNVEISYDNLFSFSDWMNSESGNPVGNSCSVEHDLETGTVTVTQSGTSADACTKHSTSKTNGNGFYYMPVTANEDYTFAFNVGSTNPYQFHVFFYTASGAQATTDRGTWFTNTSFDQSGGNGTTGRKIYRMTAPSDAAYAEIRLGTTSTLGVYQTFSNIAFYPTDIADIVENTTNYQSRKNVVRNTSYGDLYEPTRKGYKFQGWWADLDGDGVLDYDASNNPVAIDTSYTVYSTWTAYPNDVNYDNLFSLSDWANAASTSKTNKGGDITVDAQAGSLSITCPADADSIDNNYVPWSYAVPVTAGTEYVLEYDADIASGSGTQIHVFYKTSADAISYTDFAPNPYLYTEGKSYNNKIVFTPPEGTTHVSFRFGTVGLTGVTNTFSNISLYKSSNAGLFDSTKADAITNRDVRDVYSTDMTLYTPERLGWIFDGWYYDDAYSNKANATDNFFESATLYSKWIDAHVVTFYTKEEGSADNTIVSQQTVKDGASAVLPTNPTKASDDTNHYTFKSWSMSHTNVGADRNIYPTFTATAHSYTYTNNDDGTHSGTCAACGYDLEHADHTWGEAVIDPDSTCTAEGTATYTCTASGCSATETETVDKKAHSLAKVAAKAATCTDNGHVEHYACSNCSAVFEDSEGATETTLTAVTIPALGHDFSGAVKIQNAAKDGNHNWKCIRCSEYGVNVDNGDGTTTPTLNATEAHDWGDGTVTSAATCTKEGTIRYQCPVCTQTYTETIGKTAHEMTKTEAKEAACGVAGNYEYYYCSICTTYYKDAEGTTATTLEAETIAALSHKWDVQHDTDELVSPATCQSAAVYYMHCDYCGVKGTGTYSKGSPDTINGHKFDDVNDIQKNADGTHSYGCTVEGCNEYGAATTCDYMVTEDTASTCKTLGHTTYECTVCGNGYSVEKDALDFTNHEGGDEVRGKLAATCVAQGYTGNIHCDACGVLKTQGQAIPVDPTNHENEQDVLKKDATCQEAGYEAYKYCYACNTATTEIKTIAQLKHSFTVYSSNYDGTHTAICDTCDETIAEKATDTAACSGGTANCVDKAVCAVCKEAYGDIDSANHKGDKLMPKQDSTCQTEGYNAYKYCDACGEVKETITVIAKKNHSYGAWSQNADGATHSRSCTTCVDDAENGLVVATETADCAGGKATCLTLAKCSGCGGSHGEIDPNNHETARSVLKNAKAATCEEAGYTGDYHYECCDAIKTAGSVITALGHSFTVEVVGSRVPATCVTAGSVTMKCANCDETEDKALDIDAANHERDDKNNYYTILVGVVEANCEDDGYTGDTYCAKCYVEGAENNSKALLYKGKVIESNGSHEYSEAVPEYIYEGDTAENYKNYRHEDGYWYHIQVCGICGEVKEERCYTYPEHQFNCVDTDKCQICDGNCSLTDPNKHKGGALKVVEKVNATCVANGSKAYYVCESCGKMYFDAAGTEEITEENKNKLVIAATGNHTIDRTEVPKANNDGTHSYECSVCGVAVDENCSGGTADCQNAALCQYCETAYGEKNPKNHVKGTVEVGGVPVDKCKDGVSGKVVYECCPDVVVFEGDIIKATEPHDWNETTTKVDNCEAGYTITKTCNYCGETEITEIAAGTHDVSVVVYETAKDCTVDRTVYYACSICNYTDKTVEIDGTVYNYINAETIPAKAACTWSAWTHIQKPNCVVEGKKVRECLVCGKTEEEVLPKTDHTLKTEAGIPATCDKAGKEDYVYCVIEGCPYVKGGQLIDPAKGGKDIAAKGHGDYNGDGYCDNCGGYLETNADGTNCGCICHKQNWFMKIIYKILQFFWKLFRISRTCCDAGVHW